MNESTPASVRPAVPAWERLAAGALALLWVAALLTLWTGFDYLKAAVRTAMER